MRIFTQATREWLDCPLILQLSEFSSRKFASRRVWATQSVDKCRDRAEPKAIHISLDLLSGTMASEKDQRVYPPGPPSIPAAHTMPKFR